MALSFINPAFLWLLPLIPLLWLFAWLARAPNLARLGRARYAALIALRSTILAALILALAGAQAVRAVDNTAVVFLIDGSDSVAPAQRERALDYVNSAIAAGDEGDQAAVVVFGADAAVERAPAALAPLRGLSSAVVGSRTDIADAIQLGLALLPAEAQKRLVLLSDGAENDGRAVEAARLAALRGVPLEVLPLAAERGPDVLISALDLPQSAREGQSIPVVITLESGVAGPARVEIFADGALVAAEEVELAQGANSFRVSVPAGEAGFRRFEARVSAPADTQPLNNRAAAFAEVEGPPRVLLVAAAEDRAAPLRAALEAANIRVALVGPAQTPATPADLRQFTAVALVDVPAAEVPVAAQRALAAYVRDQGGGLAMIGGADSFGAGGWRRTAIANALPVELDPPTTEERPDLALALVIDRSGSMSDGAGVGRTRLDLAKDAVYLATRGLASSDQFGVFVFDDAAQEVLPLQRLPELFAIEEALGGVSPGGGTNIRAGVELGGAALAAADARVKHLILLTDGLDESDYSDLVDQLREQAVTVTIVAIGADANPALADVARRGGGAFYSVTQAQEVPEIFLRETVRVAGRDIEEGAFTPAVVLAAPPVRGLGALPPLYGYNATTPRDAARTLLVAPDGAPVLAVWQHGLGRTLAWTSDLKGQWAADWVGWEPFPRFAAGLIDALQPPAGDGLLSLSARAEGGQAVLDLFVTQEDGSPAQAPAVQGRLLGPEGEAITLTFTEVGLGRYRAVAPADLPGVYLAQVAALDAAGQPVGAVSGGVVVSYSPEYGPTAAGGALLEDLARLTGGRVAPPAESLFLSPGLPVGRVTEISLPLLWLALALLPLDIALRRLFVRPADLAPALARRPRPAAAPALEPDDAMARLRAARTRTRRPEPSPGAAATVQPTAAPQSRPAPASPTSQQPSPPRTATPEPAPPPDPAPAPAAPSGDDALAALLAAKRRRKEQ
jgi:uncharacterized membrane protein